MEGLIKKVFVLFVDQCQRKGAEFGPQIADYEEKSHLFLFYQVEEFER